ncbi:MAG: nucleoside-diphosphate-sugar epimerase [Psychromonas sp.]|jgi:nucleoside-diphosphate-sugar epimerase|uniref:dTDP-glucose 4,6-dehydratase n=1 Tax=Psychromonas sp. TaxID=1884585 RepID=UPI0039E31967
MDKSISILGSGWLGFPVAKKLSAELAPVKISTRSADKLRCLAEAGLYPFQIDIENLSDNIQDFLQSELLIINITSKNLAAFTSLIAEIELSAVKRVLFISSTSVYPQQALPCKESDNLQPSTHPLLMIESLLQNNRHFQTTILRFAGLIGGKRHPGRFFAATKQPAKVIAFPKAPVNLIHLDDCLAIITLIIKKECWGETLNGCADTHPSKEAFYTYNALALGLDRPKLNTQSKALHKVICNEKLKRLLDYQFIHSDLMRIDPCKNYD